MLHDTLATLVRFKTVTGDIDAARDCIAYVKEALADVPLRVKEQTHNGFPALVATTRRTKRPFLWLAAHLDVVPGQDTLFVPRTRKGKLYGRGAFDMKWAVACYIELMRELGSGVREYDLGLMLTSDEEWGGFHGTGHLLKRGYGGTVAFLPDGGGVWSFEECAKGKWQVEVRSTGMAAHGARPWSGHSATQELARFLTDAERVFTVFEDEARASDHWHLTMHAGLLSGGEAANTVANSATAVLDLRYTSTRDVMRAKRILTKLCAQHPNTSWRTVHCEPSYAIKRSNPHVRRFTRIAKELGRTCGFTKSHGSSDARFFAQAGIPTLLIWPEGGGHHTNEEWVDLKDLELFYAVLKRFVEETAQVRVRSRSGTIGKLRD